MPTLYDPNFAKTLTLICNYSPDHGAMGIILNQPTSLNIGELLNLELSSENQQLLSNIRVYSGGPVDTDHGFILHDGQNQYDASMEISENLYLTTSTDILEDIAQGHGPDNHLIVLGYAGWSPGQLEAEITANSWLCIDYQHELVFATAAEEQWLKAGKILGIDLNLLTNQTGHA